MNMAKVERVRGRVVIDEIRKVICSQIVKAIQTFNLSEMERHEMF